MREKASRITAASKPTNEQVFMHLMGLVNSDDAISVSDPVAGCPTWGKQLHLLQVAISHDYYPQYVRIGRCDGYYVREEFDVKVPSNGSEPRQCLCTVHSSLFSGDLLDQQQEDFKSLIRSPLFIGTLDQGNKFILALLMGLLHLFNMIKVRVCAAGPGNGVSYILLHKNKRYPFAGYPDFVGYKDDFGAHRILIYRQQLPIICVYF